MPLDYTADYEIVYNSSSHMFDVYFMGIRVDDLLPSYADGETSIQLHIALRQANEAAQSAQRVSWDELTCETRITTPYVAIDFDGGSSLHRTLPNGKIGQLISYTKDTPNVEI